jgi:hypothetical protein
MAMLNESNLLAMKAKAAKFRTHHVGTKLNEAELHEFEALAERRKQSPSELIRGLVLGEIERDQHPPRPSVELEEITALRLLLINVLPKLATGEKMPLETYQKIEAEVKNRKSSRGLELLKDWQQLECPARFVPVEMRQTGTRGAVYGAREEAYSGADREPASAGRSGCSER